VHQHPFATILLLTLSHTVLAGDHDSPPDVGKPAIPIKRPISYPMGPRALGQEGWVDVSFVVGTDGVVSDPNIEASSGNRFLEAAALRSVSRWKYEPATWNGKPVEQRITKHRLFYRLDPPERTVTPEFKTNYKNAYQLYNDGQLDELSEDLDKMERNGFLNLYESSRYWLLKGLYQRSKGNLDGAISAFDKADVADGESLESDVDRFLLEVYFRTQYERYRFADAISLYTEMHERGYDVSDEIEDTVKQIQAIAARDDPIGVKLTIASEIQEEDLPIVRYTPLRREIGVTNIDGNIDSIEIGCTKNRALLTELEGKSWAIPEDWKDCTLYIKGGEGTTFILVEYPINSGA
jgi:TonB family protein